MEENIKKIYQKIIEERKNEVLQTFNFETDLKLFINETFPADNKYSKEINEKYNKAIENKDKNILNKIKNNINAKINYLRPKSRDSEEQIRYIMILELLVNELEKIT